MKDVEKALALRDSIQDRAEELRAEAEDFYGDRQVDAMDFADAVEEKAVDIGEWIEKHDHVTDNQMQALENMLDGLERWLS